MLIDLRACLATLLLPWPEFFTQTEKFYRGWMQGASLVTAKEKTRWQDLPAGHRLKGDSIIASRRPAE